MYSVEEGGCRSLEKLTFLRSIEHLEIVFLERTEGERNRHSAEENGISL